MPHPVHLGRLGVASAYAAFVGVAVAAWRAGPSAPAGPAKDLKSFAPAFIVVLVLGFGRSGFTRYRANHAGNNRAPRDSGRDRNSAQLSSCLTKLDPTQLTGSFVPSSVIRPNIL